MDVFEYAAIRVVPRVERGEFINAGVVVFCRDQKFLRARIALSHARLAALWPRADAAEIERHLHSFAGICVGAPSASPIALLEAPARFRWLTARRSTVVQTSETHPGLCHDAAATLEALFEQLVGKEEISR